jgi:predicted  nucleic acid-binding Zn-ribbon protein
MALAATIFIGCKDNENDTDDLNDDMAVEMNEGNMDKDESMEGTYKNPKPVTKEEADKMANDISSNVMVNNDTITEIRGFKSYTLLRSNMYNFSNSTPEMELKMEETLRQTFNSFKETIPYYLRVDDVNDAIRDVEKELAEYEEEMTGKKASNKNNRENIEEIQEAFDDLEKEIIQARKKFVDNREDAMEEFMEEINSKSDQTTFERYRDAMEEYNEEIKD